MSLRASDWAAWVQAVGSIAAICAGFWTAYRQNKRASKLRQDDRKEAERDRASRAEVVAARLSGWLGEASSRITIKWEAYNRTSLEEFISEPQSLVQQWKLNVSTEIDGVMPDLHYLKNGSGDVAQLDFQIRYFEAFLEQLSKPSRSKLEQAELNAIHKNVGDQLWRMLALLSNAERHLGPLLDDAVAKER